MFRRERTLHYDVEHYRLYFFALTENLLKKVTLIAATLYVHLKRVKNE